MNDFQPTNPEMAKTDPQLDALLDDALAPGPVPAGLNDRIVAATADRLADGSTPTDNPVIGRISGGGFPWRSVAAVLLLGGVVGGLFFANRNDDLTINDKPYETIADATEQVQQGLDQLADAALQGDSIDDEIALLSMQLSATPTPSVWDRDAIESLDAAIAFEEFDQLQSELDLYF